MARFYDLFQPQHYDVYLAIDRQTKTITGTTEIIGQAGQTKIAINQKYLKVKSVKADGENCPFEIDETSEAVWITLKKIGETKLTITYSAPLTDTMMGIYPSYYEVEGQKKQLIGTQFESTAARQAFPCVDEPEAKATFSLALKFDEHPGETVLANMPEIKVEDGTHYFAETKRMSTYLVAFAFGELQAKKTKTKSGVEIGVFATKAHQAKELEFPLEIAKKAIEFYENFYQTPYPLPHSWQLALPDFSAGAMENWGLVTYREAYLLLDPDNTSLRTKQVVATVITHELAHQWFGDLVTMKWWDDLWLNESFANMMEYVAVDAIKPEWNIWELFQVSEAPAALKRDATDGVQSVHVQVENPAEIDSIFDGAIVYAKGSRMLVMVRSLIGDAALRSGLKAYFAAHKYQNATGADLWKSLGQASGMNIGKIMNSWLEQPGYPVVSASVKNGHLKLQQQQFFIGEGQAVGRKWQLPLNCNYSAVPKILADQQVDLGDYAQLRQQAGEPFRLNVGNDSHFIVKYDDQLLQDILNQVSQLDNISQMQLLQDLSLLAEGQMISYAKIVPLLADFADSHSSLVISALYSVAGRLKKFVEPDSSEEQALRQLYQKLSSKQAQRLGWQAQKNESLDDQLSRPIVLSSALYAKDPQMMAIAHQLFQANRSELIHLPADIRFQVLRNEVENYGSLELTETLLTEYQQTADGSFKDDLSIALASAADPQQLERLIAKFQDVDTIKPQDLRSWFHGVLANPHGEQAAWDWLRAQWGWLEKKVGGDMEFATYITVISNVFRTRQRLAEFKDFFEPKLQTPGLTREIKMDIRTIASRVTLIESQQDEVNTAIAASL
nr:M1 family metallopeptidase [Liquorilactobacillus sicerae]